MKSSVILTLLFTSFTVSKRNMQRGRIDKRVPKNGVITTITTNPYQDSALGSNIVLHYSNLGDKEFRFEDDIPGEAESKKLDNYFSANKDKFSYEKGILSFDVSRKDIETIKNYIPSSSKWELVHIDLLASRWYQAKNPSKELNQTINSLAGREIIYPVSTIDSPNVISVDIDEFAELPMAMDEDIESYAKRIQSSYKTNSDKKLSSIINNKFFEACDGKKRSKRETGSSSYPQCGQVLIDSINTKARFTASSLSDIYFDSD